VARWCLGLGLIGLGAGIVLRFGGLMNVGDVTSAGRIWTWLERASWLAGLISMFLAFLIGRPASSPPPSSPTARAPDNDARKPSRMPVVWNVAARNPAFTGRDDLLASLRDRLTEERPAVVHALHGAGGVGKTQLAVEYAHRFANDYDVVWWVAAEELGSIGEQLLALAVAKGLVSPDTEMSVAMNLLRGDLRARKGWLLIFDNAEDPAALREWLPSGPGVVIITSRNPGWGEVAEPVAVDVFSRPESVSLIRSQLRTMSTDDAWALARTLGDLPLALAQAIGLISQTGITAGEYSQLVGQAAAGILRESPSPAYPATLAATIQTSADRVTAEDPAAGKLLLTCAWLAPEPIPPWLLGADGLADPVRLRHAIGCLVRYGLARADTGQLVVHRLTQAVLRDIGAAGATDFRRAAEGLLTAGNPGDPEQPRTWARWAQLIPHVLATDLGATDDAELRDLACDTAWYLLVRGDIRTAKSLASSLHDRWTERLGADHHHTLRAANNLGAAVRSGGDYARARHLDSMTLARRQKVLGPGHPDTLRSAHNLARDLRSLGLLQEARRLNHQTLGQMRKHLGADHPYTLFSAGNLALNLFELGEVSAARELHEDTLRRMRQVLGEDHPDTLTSASNLARDLNRLGQVDLARRLHEDTLRRKVTIFGADHPYTLYSACALARDLHSLGQFEEARRLNADTLERRRRVLGENHPNTRFSATNLASDLAMLAKAGGRLSRPRGGPTP
jgi:hypothetical protein